MSKNLFQKKFDPNAEYVARRAFTGYAFGDKIVKKDFDIRRLKQMYESGRMIVMEDVWNKFVGVASSPAPVKGLPVVDPAPVSDGESALRALGVKVDKRWGEARLAEELEKATAPVAVLPGMTDGAA